MPSVDKALAEIDRLCGSDAVVRDPDILAQYSIDESEAEPQMPCAVVRARSTADVSGVLSCAYRHDIPVTARGGGTGRVGAAVPAPGGIVLALENMNAIKDVDVMDRYAVVQPGVHTQRLHEHVEALSLFYPPDPNSASTCTIGGNVATNAGGPRTYKYGVTRDYVLGMQAVLADGRVLNLGRRTKKGVTGYDLCSLITGSEGTLAVVTEATLRLIAKPEQVATLMVMLPALESVSGALALLAKNHVDLQCAELLDAIALDVLRKHSGVAMPANVSAMLILEIDGNANSVADQAERAGNLLLEAGALEVFVASNRAERDRLWAARKELSRTLRREAKFKISEDVVVPQSKLSTLLRRCKEIAEEHGIVMPTYGHAGDGNMHVNFLWNDPAQKPNVDKAAEALFRETLRLGGTLSGEHGIGLLKKPFLHLEQSPALIDLQMKIKQTLDPKGLLNPGKIFPTSHGAC